MRKLFKIEILLILVLMGSLTSQELAVKKVGQPQPLTSEGEYYIAPEWSPDGSYIAVTSHNYRGIWLISYPDGVVTQLTDEPSVGFGMEWSPDGKSIVTKISRYENKRRYSALAIFKVPSGEMELLSDFYTLFPGVPHWTKDGKYVYLSNTDQFRLFSVEKQKGQVENPPALEVPYVKKDKLQLRDLANRHDIKLSPVEGRILNLRLSPDETMMVFEIVGGNLHVCDREGLDVVDLGPGYAPAWSPDGEKIAYMITTDDGHTYLSADIYVINANGTGKVRLTDTPDLFEMRPTWSPDGKWIAYDTWEKGQIFIQQVEY